MQHRIAMGAVVAIALGVATPGVPRAADAQMYGYGMMGPGTMGPGTMGPDTMGPGMMSHGMMMHGPGYGAGMMHGPGYGMRGPGWTRNQGDFNISADDAKKNFELWLAMRGNSRLKVGEVKEMDNDTVTVDIVTRDNSLVQRFQVNRHIGRFEPEEG